MDCPETVKQTLSTNISENEPCAASQGQHKVLGAFFCLCGKIMIAVTLAAFLSAFLVGGLFYKQASDNALNNEIDKLTISTRLIAPLFTDAFQRLENDLSVVYATPPIKGILRATQHDGIDPSDGSSLELWKRRLETIFSSVLASKGSYLQLRYIGLADHGREIVRVDRNGTFIRPVSEKELQSKGDEFYFKAALNLAPGEFYLSPATLNREHGEIQKPYMPVIRLILPVHDEQGKLFGLLVLNASYEKVLASVLQRLSIDHDLHVLDERGNHLIYKKDGFHWEFHFQEVDPESRNNPIIQAVINSPKKEETILTSSEGKETLFYFKKLPFNKIDRNRFLAIALSIPKATLLEPTEHARRNVLLLTLVLVIASSLCAAFLGKLISRPIRNMTSEVQAYGEGREILNLPVERYDEIGYLARSFQTMLDNLRQSQNQLRTAKIFQDKVMSSIPDLIFVKDENLKIIMTNAAFEAFYESGKTDNEQAAQAFWEQDQKALSEGYSEAEETVTLPNGETHILATKKVRFENEQGEQFILGISRDITHLKKAEAEIMRSNEELERFAYIASHDLQEPLRMVSNFTILLADEYKEKIDQQGQDYIDRITRSAQRMQNLVSDLLEYSRLGTDERGASDCDTRAVIDIALENLKESVEQTGAVMSIEKNLPKITANPIRLCRLMQNLIGNAIKYRAPDRPPEIHIGVQDQGEKWLFCVKDNGIGIKKEYLGQIFEIFKRLHNRQDYSGTGIGLAVARKIVEGFDGQLWAESEFGRGSAFYFTVPKHPAESERKTR